MIDQEECSGSCNSDHARYSYNILIRSSALEALEKEEMEAGLDMSECLYARNRWKVHMQLHKTSHQMPGDSIGILHSIQGYPDSQMFSPSPDLPRTKSVMLLASTNAMVTILRHVSPLVAQTPKANA